tara:strand:+ start:642 stop:1298 length:657 start_codon:yes stop_codon:yes gene_type:complete
MYYVMDEKDTVCKDCHYIECFIYDILHIKLDKVKDGKTISNSKKHEDIICSILEKYGHDELPLPKRKGNRKKELQELVDNLSDGYYYIRQPYGTQRCPDIILYNKMGIKIKELNIELKSGRHKIMWNDGIPNKDNTLYIYTDITDKITVLFDKDILNKEQYIYYCKLVDELKKFKRKCGSINFCCRKVISQNTNDIYRYYKINKNEIFHNIYNYYKCD